MTCIAWDGVTLAADKRMGFGNSHATIRKIQRLGGQLVGFSGDSSLGRELMAWAKDGFDPERFPMGSARDKTFSLLVVGPGGALNYYCNGPHPIPVEEPKFTIGSGADYATAAMHCGKTAREAVEIACLFDPNCGNGIDTMELE